MTFSDDKIISNAINVNHDVITYMLNKGYSRTKRILSDIFSAGMDDLHTIYQKQKKMRITGDVVVTNMNRVVKKVVRHKQILELVAVVLGAVGAAIIPGGKPYKRWKYSYLGECALTFPVQNKNHSNLQ